MEYVLAAANLSGQIYGIKGTRDCAAIRKSLDDVLVPTFSPKSSVKIHLTDKEMEEDRKKEGDDAGKLASYAFNLFPPSNSPPSASFRFLRRQSPTRGAERKVVLAEELSSDVPR